MLLIHTLLCCSPIVHTRTGLCTLYENYGYIPEYSYCIRMYELYSYCTVWVHGLTYVVSLYEYSKKMGRHMRSYESHLCTLLNVFFLMKDEARLLLLRSLKECVLTWVWVSSWELTVEWSLITRGMKRWVNKRIFTKREQEASNFSEHCCEVAIWNCFHKRIWRDLLLLRGRGRASYGSLWNSLRLRGQF